MVLCLTWHQRSMELSKVDWVKERSSAKVSEAFVNTGGPGRLAGDCKKPEPGPRLVSLNWNQDVSSNNGVDLMFAILSVRKSMTGGRHDFRTHLFNL